MLDEESNMDIEKRVNELFHQLVEIRRDFHMYPEISENEHRTSDKICEYLNKWGIEYQKGVAETGVVAIVRGKKSGKTVAARADIDALPIIERSSFRTSLTSKNFLSNLIQVRLICFSGHPKAKYSIKSIQVVIKSVIL